MNCENFEIVVNDLARQQIVEANARKQALAHSNECEACAQRLKHERGLTFVLSILATETKPLAAPLRVEEHLRLAFRSQVFSPPQTRATSRQGYWIVAAAAVLLIVFGIAGMRLRLAQPAEQKSGPLEAGGTTPLPKDQTPFVEPAKAVSSPNNEVGRGLRRTQINRRVTGSSSRVRSSGLPRSGTTATATANPTKNEIATGFMPLGYLAPSNLQEGGQIVRVELSRSAMVSLGLPVNMERYGERVKADVLLSSDGLARAIRFVQ